MKDIPGYEDLYAITEDGKLWSHRKKKFFSLHLKSNGYMSRALVDADGNIKQPNIHRLVALTYIPNPKNKSEVNHINGIKHDNRKENLEWVTPSENQAHSWTVLGNKNPGKGRFGKFNPLSLPVIQYTKEGEFVAEYSSRKEAGDATGINVACICRAVTGTIKSSGGFIWRNK